MFSLRNPIYLGGSMPIGSSIGSYNPLINYNWNTNYIGSERYLTDSGSSPKYHAKMFTGQGVKFNGVDQDIGLNIPLGSTESFTGSATFDTTIATNYSVINFSTSTYFGIHTKRPYVRWNGLHYYGTEISDDIHTIDYIIDKINEKILFYVDGVFNNEVLLVDSDYNVTFSYIGSRGGSLYADCTVNNISIIKNILTPQQIQAKYQSPETFLYRDNDVLKSDVLSQTEIDNVVAYLPMCEKDEYVRDMVNYGEGNNLVTAIDDLLNNGDEVTTYSSNLVDSFDLAVTTVGTNAYRPIQTQTVNATNGDFVLIKFNAVINNGIAEIKAIKFNTGVQNIDYNIKNGENTIIVKCDSDTSVMSLYWNGTLQGDISVSNYKTVLLSGIYPIQNFTNSCRDDAKNLTSGLQTSKLKRDILGVPYGANDYYETDNTSYSEVNIPLPQSYSFELVVEELISSESQRLVKFDNGIGLTNNSDGTFNIYPKYNNDNNFIVNTISVSDLSVPSYIAFTVEDDGINSVTVSGYLNGSLVTTQTKTYLTRDAINIDRLFDFSDALGTKYEVKLFKIHDQAIGLDKISKNNQIYLDRNLLGEVVTHNLENVTHNGNTVWL